MTRCTKHSGVGRLVGPVCEMCAIERRAREAALLEAEEICRNFARRCRNASPRLKERHGDVAAVRDAAVCGIAGEECEAAIREHRLGAQGRKRAGNWESVKARIWRWLQAG